MQESPLFVRSYDFLLWLIPETHKFPRAHRFGLAEHIQRLALAFEDTLIAAGKSKNPDRRRLLEQADLLLEQMRISLRLARDLKCLSIQQYEHVARMTTEVGRLLGAWLKAVRSGSD
jgi:four helix bundle protein